MNQQGSRSGRGRSKGRGGRGTGGRGRGRGRGGGRGPAGTSATGRGGNSPQGRSSSRGTPSTASGRGSGRKSGRVNYDFNSAKMQQPDTLKNGEKGAEAHTVPEEYRIRLTKVLLSFREDESEKLEFPPTLTNTERKFIHEIAAQLGLKSKSTGKGDARHITVSKVVHSKKDTVEDNIPDLKIGEKGIEALNQHMKKFPPTELEALEAHETGSSLANASTDEAIAARLSQMGFSGHETVKKTFQDKKIDWKRRKAYHENIQKGKARNKRYPQMLKLRKRLPAFDHQQRIVQTVAANPVTIISGETGCGKSTQVPQFLLDANSTCKIVVTQPRRISAISIAERVAEEQCQTSTGGIVGYQVSLEGSVSADTQLIFMTPGFLIRQMQSSPQLCEYTHVIVDEIHERDRFQEFLMIVLRDLLPLRPDLRVILMSATLQTMEMVEYFRSRGLQPSVIEIEGRMFPVQEFFLEQVLEMTGYIDESTGYDGGSKLDAELAAITGLEENQDLSIQCVMCGKVGFADALALGEHIAFCGGILGSDDGVGSSDDASDSQFDDTKDDAAGNTFLEFDDYDVDGRIKPAGEVNLDRNGIPEPTSDLTELPIGESTDDGLTQKWDGESPFDFLHKPSAEEEDKLLTQYQAMHDDETIDYYLLLDVLRYIVKSSYGDGGILVFLPGWQEISEFSMALETSHPFNDRSKHLILPLHSGIPSRDQRRVLQRPPQGVRKIVLSTNIAETSLTIDDIAFVVDSGRAKEKSYDPHLKTSTLQETWISQASAKQRKGRAGRVRAGVCFHLFSIRRHESMRPFTESELLRTPLEEMCLMCKQLGLAPGGPDAEDGVPSFLNKALDAPHQKSVTNALELLVDLGAMDSETNDLTALGQCLAVLTLEPRVGKMVIWSYLLGCVRVACNMAVAMSYKSPFAMTHESQRRASENAKLQLSQNSESDQVTVHNALEMKHRYRDSGSFNEFCRRSYISLNTLQMISEMRRNVARDLKAIGFPDPMKKNTEYNRYHSEGAIWRAAIAAGLYPNVAYRRRGDVNFSTMTNQKLKVHVSSVNAVRGQPLSSKCSVPEDEIEFMCFGELVKGNRIFTGNQTTHLASPLPLLLLCGNNLCVTQNSSSHEEAIENNRATLSVDGWIHFRCASSIAASIVILRKRLHGAFWQLVTSPSRFELTEAEQDAVAILGPVLLSAHRSAASMR